MFLKYVKSIHILFLKYVFYAHQGYIYLKERKSYCQIIKIICFFFYKIYSCGDKAEFFQQPLHKSSMPLNPSETILIR